MELNEMQKSEDESILQSLSSFKTRSDSLRIPASRLAAITGYHPYSNLPEVFLDLVYQGKLGEALRMKDADELGLTLLSAADVLIDIANKAGKYP